MPVRIYDIAKKLGISNKSVLLAAKFLGIAAAKVPSSSIDKISAEWLEEEVFLTLPKIANSKIEEALKTGAKELDLSDLYLSHLPEAIKELNQIEALNIYSERLVELPDFIGELTQLKFLYFGGSDLQKIPAWVEGLKELRQLQVVKAGLTEVPEFIGRLAKLEELSFSANKLTVLPESLGELSKLRVLWLYENKLIALPESFRQLESLSKLYLHGNDALGLPVEILGPEFWQDEKPPANPATILDYYFRVRTGKRPLNEAKLILVGRGGVGKTCLIKRLLYDTFDEHEKETPGIEIQSWEVKIPCGDKVRLHVWDFGGQEILHATHQFFLTERTLYLLVLTGREGKPGDDAEYWLQLIRSFGGDSKVIVALNKSVQHPFDVNRGFLLEKYPFIVDFVKTDCENGSGLAALKKLIVNQTDTMEHRKTNFPKDWFAIKERLAEMTKRNENYITWEQYQKICSETGEKDADAQQMLAYYLNLLGVALNYRDDPRLKDTHVLNPRWVTEGIYPLLRTGQMEKRQGVLELKDLAETLDAKRYPKDKHEFLVGLMEKFKLCFQLPERQGKPKRWLVPELLGENQPEIKALLDIPGLGFRYQYEVLPEGLLPRFIVQTHLRSESHSYWRWRTGVVLAWEGCFAVVRADYRERRVDIHVTGWELRRRELLAVVREKFEEQHVDFKGMNVDERILVPGEPGVTASYRDLLQRELDGEDEFRPEGAKGKVRVAELLNGVESAETRAKRRQNGQRGMSGDTIIVHGTATIKTGDKTMEKLTNIKIDTNYGQVGEVLNNCTNIINQQPEGAAKELLEKLQIEVKTLVKLLPSNRAEETVDNLKLLVDSATAEKPKRKWYSMSAEGLLEASKFTKEFTGNLAGTIGQLGKSIWPDFKLPESE